MTNPNSQEIQSMFDRLAMRYDLFNLLTSMGLDGVWRKKALRALKPGMTVLDLGCGTGDLALASAERVGVSGRVVGVDFSQAMLTIAKHRAQALPKDAATPDFVLKRAEDIPFSDIRYDWVVSGFVLRNIYENIDSILEGVLDSLKEGGRISFLDLTEPPGRVRRAFWKFYMQNIVKFYGRLLFGKDYPADYLTESARRFLKPQDFSLKLKAKGFSEVEAKKLFFGMIVLYEAKKNV